MRRAYVWGCSVPSELELAAWRRKIVDTRLRISHDEPPASARALWSVVDGIEACIKISGADFDEQMDLVDREIEERLTQRRGTKARRIPYLQRIRTVPDRRSRVGTALLNPAKLNRGRQLKPRNAASGYFE